jgi:TrmH family RNA methyltransferase
VQLLSDEALGPRHQRVQRLRRLLQRHSVRHSERCFVVEGVKVLDAALEAEAPVEAVYADPSARQHPPSAALLERARSAGVRVVMLRSGVMERVADTVAPQPVCGVVGFVDVPLHEIAPLDGFSPDEVVPGEPATSKVGRAERAPADGAGRSPLLVCVDVRDPGNLGALVRVADAAGAGGVITCAGTADVYGPKTVRASAGSLFHVPLVLGGEPAAVLEVLGAAGYTRLGTLARGGQDYVEQDLSGKVALVFGNEANGLPEGVASLLDGGVTVPMSGRAESLNVAMTATVLCFEIERRRRQGLTSKR